jgi:hypothetical protein
MIIEFLAFDSEEERDVTPINLPYNYRPAIGQVLETTSGTYRVIGYYKDTVDGVVLSVTLHVRKVR